jgi:hypothetical protein
LVFNSDVRFYWLILGVLSVWRVTHLFVAEDGPWNLLARLRQRASEGFFASLLDCFYCFSLWTAAPVAWLIGQGIKERLLLWLALSGGAIVLERTTNRAGPTQATVYYEDPED